MSVAFCRGLMLAQLLCITMTVIIRYIQIYCKTIGKSFSLNSKETTDNGSSLPIFAHLICKRSPQHEVFLP